MAIQHIGSFDIDVPTAADQIFYNGTKWARLKNSYAETTDPTVNDDDSADYVVGSIWINTSTDNSYICLDNSTGAAVWRLLTLQVTDAVYLNMYLNNNSTQYVIQNSGISVACDLFINNINDGINFSSGSRGTFDAAAVVDLGGTPNEVRMPATGHGLSAGDIVSIQGTTNYNGVFEITNVNDPNTFDIESAFVSETLATSDSWSNPSVSEVVTTGVYHLDSSLSVTNNGATDQTYEFQIYNGVTGDPALVARQRIVKTTTENVNISGMLSLTSGDKIWISIRNETGTTNAIFTDASLLLTLT